MNQFYSTKIGKHRFALVSWADGWLVYSQYVTNYTKWSLGTV